MNCTRWYCLVLGLALSGPRARAQPPGRPPTPQAQARAYAAVVRQHMERQEFDRATLPVYLRALRLDRRAGNDTLLARHGFLAGITYNAIGQLDSAAVLLRESMRRSIGINNLAQLTQAGGSLTGVYQKQARPDSARAVRRRMEALYPRTAPGSPARDNLDDYLAGYYQDEGQYARSMGYRLAILAYKRQRRDTANLGVALANVGELFYLQRQYRAALRYRFEGLRWLRLDPDMHGTLPVLYSLIGKTYRDLHRLDSARMQYETALGLVAREPDPDAAGYLHSELSMVLAEQGHLVLARQHSRQALASYAHSADLDAQSEAYYFAGELELRARNPAVARAHLRRAYALARRVQNKDRIEPIARLLAEAEAAGGNYAAAYRLRGESAALLDSSHATAGQRAMAEMEARYQNRDKQRQIGQLDRENRLRRAETAAQRRAKYLAFAAVAGLLLLVGLVGYLLRQRQRTAALLARQNAALATANQAKVRLFSIISHDLRAPVGNLFQLLDLQQEAPDLLDEATRASQAAYLRQTSRDLLDTMEELLAWSKDQLEGFDPVPETLALAPVLAELRALYEPLARRKNIGLAVDCPPGLTGRTDPNFLRVVLRNLVQNAIKFTPAGGTVRLAAAAGAGGAVALEVADTGPGLSAAQLGRLLADDGAGPPPADPAHGLGLRLTREFVGKLGGTLTAAPAPGGGTVFRVVV